jgi:hypothetical protein
MQNYSQAAQGSAPRPINQLQVARAVQAKPYLPELTFFACLRNETGQHDEHVL